MCTRECEASVCVVMCVCVKDWEQFYICIYVCVWMCDVWMCVKGRVNV